MTEDVLSAARRTHGITLGELARELPGVVGIDGDPNVAIYGAQQDSRLVRPGDVFLARKGKGKDGAAFAKDAREKGAVALLCERDDHAPSPLLPTVYVQNAPMAIARAAAAVYGHPSFGLDVVGITGTNGKTTTSHLVRSAIDRALGSPMTGVLGTNGHFFRGERLDTVHTTPESDEVARLLRVMKLRGATHVVMEVSSIALSLARVEAVRFSVAAFSNFTQDHLDFHRSMEAYAEAKLRLFKDLMPGTSVVNVDDSLGARVVAAATGPVLRVSTKDPRAEVLLEAHAMSLGGIRATVRTPSGTHELVSKLVGAHNLENLALAIGIATALSLPIPEVLDGLAEEAGPPGRFERVEHDGRVGFVDYAHTPDALERALATLRASTTGRVLCVFGCGGDRDPTKRAPMGRIAALLADWVVVTNDNPRSEDPEAIAREIVAGIVAAPGNASHEVVLDRRDAIRRAASELRPGDALLVAGKGHEDYQLVGAEKRVFSDRDELLSALRDTSSL